MSPEAQRIAIAEACGWTEIQWSELINPRIAIENKQFCRDTEQFRCLWLPDYLNDLNAMHEAEVTLTYEDAEKYEGYLRYGKSPQRNPLPFIFAVAHTSARQRAEAFLKTIGKWKEQN